MTVSEHDVLLPQVIFELRGGVMVPVHQPVNPESFNFVIVSHQGRHDWSGFRQLAGCVAQFPALESAGRPDGFYLVVER